MSQSTIDITNVTKIAPELSTKGDTVLNPRYRMMQYPTFQNPMGASVTVPLNGTVKTLFVMPIDTGINLHRSKLRFNIQVPAQGANLFSFIPLDRFTILQNIRMYTSKGQELIKPIDQLPVWTQTMWGRTYPKNHDFKHYSATDYICPSNDTTAATHNTDTHGNDGSRNYEEMLHWACAQAANAATYFPGTAIAPHTGLAAAGLDFYFDLSLIPATIFSQDKDVIFNETVYLEFTWGMSAHYAFTTQSVNNPYDGNRLAITVPLILNNLYFMGAEEQNEGMLMSIRAKVNAGTFMMNIPQVTSNLMNINASTTQAITETLRPEVIGSYLRYLTHIVADVNNVIYAGTVNDVVNDNVNSAIVVSFRTKLDNNLQQNDVISANGGYDYYLQQEFLKKQDSLILNSPMFLRNYVYIEDFTNGNADDYENHRGLKLDTYHTWQYNATTTNHAYTHYTFFVGDRTLFIGPQGIIVTP